MITCYLDSQDYSTLTDPKRQTHAIVQTRNALLALAQTQKVLFVFSAAALSEAAPLDPDWSFLAEFRGEFLSDLCGTNALISFDRLLDVEMAALGVQQSRPLPSDALDLSGDWFPYLPLPDIPSQTTPWEEMRVRAEDELKSLGYSRHQRRAELKKMFKRGQPTTAFAEQMKRISLECVIEEIIREYPMKREHAAVIAQHVLGRVSEQEFDQALRASLRDPRWMMKWFATNHALAGPIADMVRKPGQELGEILRTMSYGMKQWASELCAGGKLPHPTSKQGAIARRWREMQEDTLISLAKRFAEDRQITVASITAKDVDLYCPGLSAMVRSIYSSVWDNVGGSRKEQPSDSQPVDAMHAMYAPYVTVFRADSFMAPHIQRQVQRHGTIVEACLPKLPSVLADQIVRSAADDL
ncbi:MAG TPA: hypothetical protein VFF03_06830 [Rhodocyclaceae bacterium]|nr:hypothetical protein [Rhodocyclaceae bacterium]